MIDKAHCILCGKEYTYWRCIRYHYEKEHPDATNFIRIREIAEVMDEEARSFLELEKVIGGWI